MCGLVERGVTRVTFGVSKSYSRPNFALSLPVNSRNGIVLK